MRWLALVPVVLALSAPPSGVTPALHPFEVWHGSKPSAWTPLTAAPRPEAAQSARPLSLSDEVAGSKPVLSTLLRARPSTERAAAPVERFALHCPATKPVAEALSANSC